MTIAEVCSLFVQLALLSVGWMCEDIVDTSVDDESSLALILMPLKPVVLPAKPAYASTINRPAGRLNSTPVSANDVPLAMLCVFAAALYAPTADV